MITNYIEPFIKLLGINLCITYSFFKIIDYKSINNYWKFLLISFNIFLSIIGVCLNTFISSSFTTIILYIIYNSFLSIFTRKNFGYTLIITILSLSISYMSYTVMTFIVLIFKNFFHINFENSIYLIIISFLDFILIYNLFKLKRFKNGFPFLKNKEKNDYFDIFTLIIGAILIYMYFIIGNYYKIHPQYLFYEFVISSLIIFIVLQKTFILYQKHKLLERTLKEYEVEIKEKDNKIDQLLNDENKLIKANHEFYHRQEALKHKLMNLKERGAENLNEEYGEIIERIDLLTSEYKKQTENLKTLHKLPKTEISEIDDMFSYLQSECYKNNIEFVLKINGNIHSLINHIISKNRLETLIGDLIRNSIIAITYSNKEYRSITAILGIKENFYEFCVYDSGIEFQKETLLKLGLEKATTHEDNGGTGIGYITTFETLNSCQASLIINELEPDKNNYTKSITIRFDDKNEYIINTYRFSEFSLIATSRPGIIIKNIERM